MTGHAWRLFTWRNPISLMLSYVWMFLVQKKACLVFFPKILCLIRICANTTMQLKKMQFQLFYSTRAPLSENV